MKSILNVLVKVFVIQFYQSHISLFLFVFGMSAGFMRAEDHLVLGALMISSPLLTSIPIIIWTTYTIISIKFNSDLLSLPENGFVYTLAFTERKKQVPIIASVISLQLAPAIGYGIFLMSMATTNQQYSALIEILLTLISLTTIGTLQFYYRIINFRNDNKQSRLTILLNKSFIKPFPFFFPEWIARKELFVLLGTKACTLLLLYATSQLYKFDTYDVRLIAMAAILSFAAQSHLIWNLHYFENQVMTMTRNMPLSFPARLINLMSTLGILLLPETAFIVARFPSELGMFDLLSVLLVGWTLCLFFYGFLFWTSTALDQLTTRIFFSVIALLILTISKVPVMLLSTFLFVSGSWLWITNYYSYEPKQNPMPGSAHSGMGQNY